MNDIKKHFQKLIKNIIQIKEKDDEELLEIELKSKLISFLNIFYNNVSLSIISNINQLNYISKEFLSDEDDSEDNNSSPADFSFDTLLKKTNEEYLSNDDENYYCSTDEENQSSDVDEENQSSDVDEENQSSDEDEENQSSDEDEEEEEEEENDDNQSSDIEEDGEGGDENQSKIKEEIQLELENNQFCLARVHPKNTVYFHKTKSEDAIYSYRLAGHCFGKQCSRKKKNGDLCTMHTTNQKLQLITERPKEIPDEAKVSDIWVHEPDPYDLSGRLSLSTVIHKGDEYQVCKESGEVFKDGVLVGKYSNQEVTLYKKKNNAI